jgi:Tfp pilus assembly protein PilX
MKRIRNNQRGATAMFLTVLVLSAVTTITFAGSQIILTNLRVSRERYDSTRAYYAAESGAERVIWEIRNGNLTPLDDCTAVPPARSYFCYLSNGQLSVGNECKPKTNGCDPGDTEIYTIDYGSTDAYYFTEYYEVGGYYYLETTGMYGKVGRRVQLRY